MISTRLVQSARLAVRPQLSYPVAFRSQAAVGRSPIRSQARAYAGASARESDNRAKLTFRVKLRDIPVELYPLGFVVVACVIGASVALTRILMHDPDMLHHRSVGSGQVDHNSPIPGTDNEKK